MKDSVAVFGICADNNDPWGVGRIRVIIDDSFNPPVRTSINIRNYVGQLDHINTTKNGENAYAPWDFGSENRMPDPYLISPFLPKHINIIPKVGESVKIIYYKLGSDVTQREYVGPHTSNYDKLNFDPIETGRAFTSRTLYVPDQNNLREQNLVAGVEDIAFSGRDNSEIVFPNKAVVIRAGHQDFVNSVKNNRAALIQSSYFTTRQDVSTQTVQKDNTPILPISYLMEFNTKVYDKTTSRLYIETTVLIYKASDVNTSTYSPYKKYLPNPDDAEFMFVVSSSTVGNIVSFVKKFLNSMDKSYSIQPLTLPSTNPNFQYTVLRDNRVSETGAAIDDTYNIGIFMFRPSIENDLSIEEVAGVVGGLPAGLHPTSKLPTKSISEESSDVVTPNGNFDESVVVTGADKVFLLSWHDTKSLQNKIGKYGFSQEEIYLTLQKETEPMVKGESLRQLILELIDLVEKHGHNGLNPGGMDKNGTDLISAMKDKYALTTPVNKDLSGGSFILNQYLRLN